MKQRGTGSVIATLSVIFAIGGFGLLASGCSSITGYSVSSYQGPLPMDDYQWLEQQSNNPKATKVVAPSVPDSTVRK